MVRAPASDTGTHATAVSSSDRTLGGPRCVLSDEMRVVGLVDRGGEPAALALTADRNAVRRAGREQHGERTAAAGRIGFP